MLLVAESGLKIWASLLVGLVIGFTIWVLPTASVRYQGAAEVAWFPRIEFLDLGPGTSSRGRLIAGAILTPLFRVNGYSRCPLRMSLALVAVAESG